MTRLTGRDREIELVDSFVDQATVRGGALLLSGGAGVGKTALLDVAASHATATGAQVVYASGAQFEANVSFAGLHQLLYPLLGYLPRLEEPQRAALGSALGLAEGRPPTGSSCPARPWRC